MAEEKDWKQKNNKKRRLALVVSKGSLDMAYPPLILATTAASLDWEVGVFFTFYGLDILHKKRVSKLKVAPLGNPAMPPLWQNESTELHAPNLLGIVPGATALVTRLMKQRMKKAKMPTVIELLELAKQSDVKLYACTTTMGVMGVREKDLIEGTSCLGAAAFLDFAADADVALFI